MVEVAREAYPDPTAESGGWVAVDMKAVRPLARPVSLGEIKATAALAEIPLIRQSRLSVMPVSKTHWELICRMSRKPS